jgi:hypothetical protein
MDHPTRRLNNSAPEPDGAQKWEYVVVEFNNASVGMFNRVYKVWRVNGVVEHGWELGPPIYELYMFLNHWGAQGWELASLNNYPVAIYGNLPVVVFKRPARKSTQGG